MKSPTVTVIIPTYNCAHFICEAIDSVLAQTRPVDEILVVNDGSTDNTRLVLAKYGNSITYIHQENAGAAAALNTALRQVRSDFIAFLDADDIWVSDKNDLQFRFFASHPDVEIVFSDMANFSGRPNDAKLEIKNKAVHDYLVTNSSRLDRFLELLVIENVIPMPTVMIRRTVLERIGFFNESLTVAYDLDYWFRSACSCRWGFVHAVLLQRRRHPGNSVGNWTRLNTALAWVLANTARQVAGDNAIVQDLVTRKLRSIHYDLGSAFLKKRDFDSAYAHLKMGRQGGFASGKYLVKLIAVALLRGLKSRNMMADDQRRGMQ